MRTVLRDCLSGMLVVVAGSWRDRTGLTRPLLLLSLIGEAIGTGVSLVAVYLWSSSTWILGGIEGIIVSLTGGRQLFIMAATCYITDTSTLEDRTTRMSYFIVALLGGGCVASGTSGYILSALDYQYFFILVIGLHVICIVLCYVVIEEERKGEVDMKGILDFSGFKIVFDSRPNNFLIWSMIISFAVITSEISGEGNIFVYYLEQGFNYSVTEAGLYSSYRMAVGVVGTLVLNPLASKIFKWGDNTILMASVIITIITCALTAFATTELELNIVTVFEWARAIFISTANSVISKSLKEEEVGIFFGLSSIWGAILPLAMLPAYDWLFNATIQSLPGAFFFLSAGFNILILVILSMAFSRERKNKPIDIEKSKSDKSESCDKSHNSDESKNCDKIEICDKSESCDKSEICDKIHNCDKSEICDKIHNYDSCESCNK